MKTLTLLLLLMLPCAAASNIEKRITGGTPCNANERHYHVVITAPGGCGGSLISAQYVLTAAHCGTLPNGQQMPMTVLLGTHTSFGTAVRQVNIPVANQIVYPGHDIMLLKLIAAVAHFPFAHLPGLSRSSNGPCVRPAIGQRIRVAGYGGTMIGRLPNSNLYVKGGPQPPNLMCGTMKMAVCRSNYEPNTFCYDRLPGSGTDTCAGDSGAGVEYNGFIHGVHIAGRDTWCTAPAIAKDICPFITWIKGIDNNIGLFS